MKTDRGRSARDFTWESGGSKWEYFARVARRDLGQRKQLGRCWAAKSAGGKPERENFQV